MAKYKGLNDRKSETTLEVSIDVLSNLRCGSFRKLPAGAASRASSLRAYRAP